MKKSISLVMALLFLCMSSACGRALQSDPPSDIIPTTSDVIESRDLRETSQSTSSSEDSNSQDGHNSESDIHESSEEPARASSTATEVSAETEVKAEAISGSATCSTLEELLNATGLTEKIMAYYVQQGLIKKYDGVLRWGAYPDNHSFSGYYYLTEEVDHHSDLVGYNLVSGRLQYTCTLEKYVYYDICPDGWCQSEDTHLHRLEHVASIVCSYCGKHDCTSLTYSYFPDGTAYSYDYQPQKCYVVYSEKYRCGICQKLYTADTDKLNNEPDVYCNRVHLGYGS